MTFLELEKDLPNGFHDCELHSIFIDFLKGKLRMVLNLSWGDPGRKANELYKMCEVILENLCFCAIDPPDYSSNFLPDGSPLIVSGDCINFEQIKPDEKIPNQLPKNITSCRFFVYDWNAFIYIAGSNVNIAFSTPGAG